MLWFYSALKEYGRITKLLLENGANPNLETKAGTPIQIANAWKNDEIVNIFNEWE